MKKVIDGVLAGLMISLGGVAFMALYSDSKIVGALLFSVGLLCVCWKGYSLFTGKIGLVIDHHTKEDISVLLLGLLGNTVGAVAMGYLIAYAIPVVGDNALLACTAKLTQGYLSAFIRAIFCGVLIYLAVDIYKNKKSTLGIIFCVPAFILSGYEHSIADIFYFAASGIASAKALLYIWIVIAGNSVGGLLIPAFNLLSKVKIKKKNSEENPDNSEKK